MNALEFLVSEFDMVTIKLHPRDHGQCVASVEVDGRFAASPALPVNKAIAQAADTALRSYRERRYDEINAAERALERAEDVEAE